MTRTRLTPKKKASLIREEKAAAREYRKLGLSGIAKDEAKHARQLQKKKPRS